MPPKKFSNKKKKTPKKPGPNKPPVKDHNNEQQVEDGDVEESEVDDSGGVDVQHTGVGGGEDADAGERNDVDAAGERNDVPVGPLGERDDVGPPGERNDVDAAERNGVDGAERNDVDGAERNDVDADERNDVDPPGEKNDVDPPAERNDLDTAERSDVDPPAERNDVDTAERSDLGAVGEKDPEDTVAKNDEAERVDDTESPNTNTASTAEVAGLAELVQIIKDLGSATDHETPRVKTELVHKLKETSLYPAYEALWSSWQNILSRMSAMEAGSVPLPHSPPLTPRDMSDNSTQDQHHRPRNASSPSRKLVDHQTQTTPPETAVSIKPTRVDQPRNAPSPRQLVDKQTQTTPPQTAVSIQPTQVAPSNSKELKALEAGITSLSSKIESMSQKMSKLASGEDVTKGLGVVDNRIGQAGSKTIEQVKATAGATKAQVDKIDTTVSQLSTRLESGVSSLHQGLKQVQDSLAKRPAAPVPVTQNPRPDPKPDLKTGELETQVKQLHHVLDRTRAELLQADMAFKIALEGDLYEEADAAATSTDSTNGMDSGRDALQIAQGIRIRTVRLIKRCRTLFSLVVGGHGSADANLGIMEGEWGRCVDHLQARDLIVRKAVREKNEAFRELQCFHFIVDQIRRGFYNRSEWRLALNAAGQNFADLMEPTNDAFSSIQDLAQEMYRLQHSP